MFFSDSPETAESQSSSQITVGSDILMLLQKLKVVSIDPSLFSSPLLTNLKDSSVQLFSENQGRVNPFALTGLDTVVSVGPTRR